MSTGLKTLISISTVFLLLLIVAYHMLEIQVGQDNCFHFDLLYLYMKTDNDVTKSILTERTSI